MVILQATPNDFDINHLTNELKIKFKEIEDIHGVHLWTLDGQNNVMTFHMVVNRGYSVEEVVELKKSVKHYLEHEGIGEVNIDIENLGNCSDNYKHNH